MPTGVARTGTSQASASSTASPKPSRSDGTSTALAALTHRGTRSGSTRAERRAARTPAASRERERAIVALLRTGGVGGEQEVRPARGPGPARRAPARGGADGSARGPRRRAAPARAAAPPGRAVRRASEAETAASRSISGSTAAVATRVRGWRTSVPCTVSARTRAGTARAGQAVRPKCACTTSKRGGRAGGRASRARRSGGAGRARRRASALAPGGNSCSSTSSPSSRRSAATWSRTKRPRSGWAASGSMLETTSARKILRP